MSRLSIFPRRPVSDTEPGETSIADLKRWQSARTFADLGALTAQWIEGRIAWQPAYDGPGDVDDPQRLVPVLASLNRAGYVTSMSQQALCGPAGGATWTRRAGVVGYATEAMTDRICNQAPIGLHVLALDPVTLPPRRNYWGNALTVTWRDGEDYFEFGGHVCQRSIRHPRTGYGLLHPAVQQAVCRAWQLTVIDLEPGRDDLLWDFLSDICEEVPQ